VVFGSCGGDLGLSLLLFGSESSSCAVKCAPSDCEMARWRLAAVVEGLRNERDSSGFSRLSGSSVRLDCSLWGVEEEISGGG